MTNQVVILKSRRAGSLWITQEQQRAMLKFEREMQEKILQTMWGVQLVKKKRVRRKMKKNDVHKGSN